MAFAKLEDLYGVIELTIFPNNYQKLKKLLIEESMATIIGKLNIRTGEKPTVIVDEIIPWKTNIPQKSEKIEKLYLKFDLNNIKLYNSIVTILSSYPGSSEVIVKCSSSENVFKMNRTISTSKHLLVELLGLLPENDIIVK